MEKLDAVIEQNRIKQERRQQRTQQNIQIFRDDLYQGIMKPFFSAGEDFRDFQSFVLKEPSISVKAQKAIEETYN
jgi:hypothetical protein